jgi:hypothetical protein
MKKKIILLIATFLLSAGLLSACFLNRGQLTVEFVIDGRVVATQWVSMRGNATNPGQNFELEEGQVFEGWYRNANFRNAFNFEGTVITRNTTIYGKVITIEKRTYTFITNGGTSVSEIYDFTVAASPTTIREDWYFGGWFNNAALSGNPVTFPYHSADGTRTTLYAKWLATPPTTADFAPETIFHAGITWYKLGDYVDGAGQQGVLYWAGQAVHHMRFHGSQSRYDNSDVRHWLTQTWTHRNTLYDQGGWKQVPARLNGNINHPLNWSSYDQWGNDVTDNYFLLSMHELTNPAFFANNSARAIGQWYWTRSAVGSGSVWGVNSDGAVGGNSWVGRENAVVPALLLI